MSIVNLGVPEGMNGVHRDLEPSSRAEAESVLTGAPLTDGYRPTLPVQAFQLGQSWIPWTSIYGDIEAMLIHPRIVLPYSYYKAGIAHADFKITANSPEVQRFHEIMLRRFWERSLTQVQHGYDYGWLGAELCYQNEKGYLTYKGLQDFHAFDTWALTNKHRYVGVVVQSIEGAGKVRLWGPRRWPAKGFWFAHKRRYNRWYGRSQLIGAWRPYRRLATRDGAEEVVDGGFYRFAYRGPIVRFPKEAFRKPGCPGDVDWQGARDHAREMAERAKAGFSVALPGDLDSANNYKWQLEWPETVLNLGPLIEYVQYVESEIAYGLEVPPELIEAAETGSGWSGRKVPLIGFYVGQLQNARNLVWAYKTQIGDPLTWWNFGPKAKWEAEVVLKVPDAFASAQEEAMKQQAQQGPQGQPVAGPQQQGPPPEQGQPQ
jgi:hypothetical protein